MRQSLLSQYASRNSFMIKKKMIISLTRVWKPPRQDIGELANFLKLGVNLTLRYLLTDFLLTPAKTALAFVEYTLFLIYVTESYLR